MNDSQEEIYPAISFDAASAESAELERAARRSGRNAKYCFYAALAAMGLAIVCAAFALAPDPSQNWNSGDWRPIAHAAPVFFYAGLAMLWPWGVLSIVAQLKAIRWDLARKK